MEDHGYRQLYELCRLSQQTPFADKYFGRVGCGPNPSEPPRINASVLLDPEQSSDVVMGYSPMIRHILPRGFVLSQEVPTIFRALINNAPGWVMCTPKLADGVVLVKQMPDSRKVTITCPQQLGLTLKFRIHFWKSPSLTTPPTLPPSLSRSEEALQEFISQDLVQQLINLRGKVVLPRTACFVTSLGNSLYALAEFQSPVDGWIPDCFEISLEVGSEAPEKVPDNLAMLLPYKQKFLLRPSSKPPILATGGGEEESLDTSCMDVDEPARISSLRSSVQNLHEYGFGGLEPELHRQLEELLILTQLSRTTRERLGIQRPKGVLLHGPPGTGKTLLARVLSQLIQSETFQLVRGPELNSKYFGQTEESIRDLFKAPIEDWERNGLDSRMHLIAIDEIDAVLPNRGTHSSSDIVNRQVNQFLTMIDGFDKMDNVMLIGMTNRPDYIDPAALRPGRLEVHLRLPAPSNRIQIQQILEVHLKPLQKHSTLNVPCPKIVELIPDASIERGLTGAVLKQWVRDSVSHALRRTDYHAASTRVELADFIEMIQTVDPSLDGAAKEALKELLGEGSDSGEGEGTGEGEGEGEGEGAGE